MFARFLRRVGWSLIGELLTPVLMLAPAPVMTPALVLVFALVMVPAVGAAQSLPSGGSVVSGQVTTTKGANTLTIDQHSENAILNWQSFSIGSHETVDIVQPNSSAVLLDRVTGNTPSVLAGHLDANGQVFLINPNGIAITSSGVVDVGGGFVASTLGLSDDDFKNGKLSFSGSGASAGVSNQGTVTVGRGGYAALLGGSVNNAGLIRVPMGKVGLGSGEAATLDVSGDGFLQVAVPTRSAGQTVLIQSSGTISAQGGTVILSAATARAAARNAINLTGVVQATSIFGQSGAITLSGGAGGTVEVSGDLDVSGGGSNLSGGAGRVGGGAGGVRADREEAGGVGGAVTITGEQIALHGALIDASGANGGGTIGIGGDLHGGGTLLQADTLSVDAASVIQANATTAGNGGSIVLWSDESTAFSGKISATGGPTSGAGGNAEVSSKNLLNYAGSANLSAPHGSFGDLLLDPYNVTIETGSTTGGPFGGGTFTAPSSNSILSVSDLQNALANASVTVTTGGSGSAGSDAGNITVANALTWASGSTLTLTAYHSITVEAPITITGNGGLHLTTNNGGSGGALTFWPGVSAEFSGVYTSANDGGNSSLDGKALGSLAINGNAYTLVNSMSGFASMATSSGTYTALAIPLTSTTNYTHAVVSNFAGTFEGLGNTLSNLTINSTDADIGLFGTNSGTIRDFGLLGGTVGNPSNGSSADIGGLVGNNQSGATLLHVFNTGAVNAFGPSNDAGGLVGANFGHITSSYATGAVTGNGTGDGQYGGLVGYDGGAIDQCFAAGLVSDYSSSAGGLVGYLDLSGTISNSYATGAVYVAISPFAAGGLVGDMLGSVSHSYATGVVSASHNAGGLIGSTNNGPYNGTSVSNSTWDTDSSGIGSGGSTTGGVGYTATGITVTGTSKASLQTANEASTLGSDFAGGAGIYPYLTSIFPDGVQTVSGTAYKDSGVTALASTSAGAGLVSLLIGSTTQGTVTTGATGYYYFALPGNTISSSGSTVLAYTQANGSTGAQNGATLVTATGSTSGVNVYGGNVIYTTSATSLSSATTALATLASSLSAPSWVSTLTPIVTATGASFTVDEPITASSSIGVTTTAANAPITVADAITLNGANSLTLSATGALAIDAPVTIAGAGSVVLDYNTASATNLTFAFGDSINYGSTSHGGTLSINGQTYTLLYKLTDSSAATGNGPDTGTDDIAGIDNAGDSGYYALATNVSGTGSAAAAQFAHSLVGSGGNSFNGIFEGLGNTITNLTISSSDSYIGLIGQLGGTLRDIGLIGGDFAGVATAYAGGLVGIANSGASISSAYTGVAVSAPYGEVGGLVGYNSGSISNSYATGSVSSETVANVGGLVGYNGGGSITNSYATGAVSSGSVSNIGGLVGANPGGSINNSYASGAVIDGASNVNIGGIVGDNIGSVNASYWDVTTSGVGNGVGSGTAAGTGFTTGQLQGTVSLGSSTLTLGSAFAGGAAGTASGGANGEYPYLVSFFPSGVQTISGKAYQDSGVNALASGTNGAGLVTVNVGGTVEGTVSTGVNGYYYLAMAPGTISGSGSTVLAYTQANTNTLEQNGATLATESGSASGVNVYGGNVIYTTSATSLSSATTALATLASSLSAPSWVSTLTPIVTATGASFTVDEPITASSSIGVTTTAANAPITVADAITLNGANSLTLSATGALAIDAPVTIAGAGSVVLDYNTASATNLTFAFGDSINYGSTSHGGTLSINGQTYTLLYKLTDSSAATGNGPDTGTDDIAGIDNAGNSGYYALATNVSGTGSAGSPQFAHPLVSTFSGTFEGLGNTITDLTIGSSDANVGLFGTLGGTVRDVGMVGGAVSTSSSSSAVGGLAGLLNGTSSAALIVNSFNTGTVTNGTQTGVVGGLVGESEGTSSNALIEDSFTTGAVSSGGYSSVGGLVGILRGGTGAETVAVQNSYAGGAVTGAFGSSVGGLVGDSQTFGGSNPSIVDSFATGAVTSGGGGNGLGAVLGYTNGVTLTNAYFDSTTTGLTAGVGNASGGTGFSTTVLQSTSNSGAALGSAFTGGATGSGQNGVYPYLLNFFPSGVQAISGTAYQGAGSGAPLASGLNGAGLVSVASGGAIVGTATTSGLGYYYVFVPAGTLAANQGVVAFTQTNSGTSAQNAVTFTQSSGGATLANVNVYGGWERDQPGSAITTLSGLNSAIVTAEGSTVAAGFTLANREIDAAASSFSIDQSVSLSGALVLSSTGAVNESNSATITAASLLLSGTGGSFTLTDGNQVTTLAGSAGSMSFSNTENLSTGSLSGAAGTAVAGITTSGSSSVVDTGNLTLAAGAAISAQSPVLAATGAFVNDAGSSAVTATSGRWLIYSSSPSVDTFGALNSANTAIFDATYSTLAPGSVTQNGDRYLFANQPVLTVTSTSDSKAYGVNDSASISSDYSITGLPSVSGVFLANTLANVVSGAPTVTSVGSGAYEPVSGSPYTMTVGLGSLTSSAGYTFNPVSSGQLTITQATITVAGATGINKTYDATTALTSGSTGYTLSGIYSNDLGNVTVSATTDAYASPLVGNESINVSGLSLSGSASGNYQLSSTSTTGSGYIGKATITVAGATGINKTYDTTTALLSGDLGYTLSGIYSNDLGNVTVSATTDAYASPLAGNESINVSGLSLSGSASGNYQLSSTSTTGSGNIGKATITVAGATGINKTYDTTTALPMGATGFTDSGILAGDSGHVTVSASSTAYASPNAGAENIDVSGLSLSGSAANNYQLSSTSVTGSGTVGQATITVAGAAAVNKTYDATTALPTGATGFTTSGIFGSDASNVAVNAANAAYAGANAGPEAVDVAGLTLSGSAAGNYVLSSTSITGSGTISPAVLNLAGTRVYDGATDASAAIFGASGTVSVLGGQTLKLSGAGTLAGKNAGSETLSSLGTLSLESGTGLASNYTLTGGTDSVEVTPATLTVAGATGVDKTYNGSTALPAGATGFTTSGLYGVDAGEVTVTAAHAAYASAASGTEPVLVSGLTLSGPDADDYVLSATSVTGSGTISAGAGHTGSVTLGGLGGGGAGGGGSAADGGARGSGSFVLSGTVTQAGSTGLPETVIGTLSNGAISISGTFIVESAAGAHPPVADELAASTTDIVVYVPGTLSASVAHPTTAGLASNTDNAAWNEYPTPTDVMPRAYPNAGDWAAPWSIVDALGALDFAQAFVCIKDSCARTTAR